MSTGHCDRTSGDHCEGPSQSWGKECFMGRCDRGADKKFLHRCRNCLWNYIINGIFTTSRTIGYTQFMVFMILRVIITGSLCGRLFGNDPFTMNCSTTSQKRITSARPTLSSGNEHNVSLPNQDYIIEVSSYDVMIVCLNSAYSNVSPITIWALSTLSVFVPPFILLPFTPTKNVQEYVECRSAGLRWPRLTIYPAYLTKAFIRFLLELLFLVIVPVLYGRQIPSILTCHRDLVTCDMTKSATVKTYFLWFFEAVNLTSCLLTILEIVDIYRNKHIYETDRVRCTFRPKTSSTPRNNGGSRTYHQPDQQYNGIAIGPTVTSIREPTPDERQEDKYCTPARVYYPIPHEESYKRSFEGRVNNVLKVSASANTDEKCEEECVPGESA